MGPQQSRYQEALARVAAGEKVDAGELRGKAARAADETKFEQEDLARAVRGEEPLVGFMRRPQSEYRPSAPAKANPQKPEWQNSAIMDNGPADDDEIVRRILSNVAGEVRLVARKTSEPKKYEVVPNWMCWKSPKEIPIDPELDFFSAEFEKKLANLLKGWYVEEVGHRPEVMKEIGAQAKELPEVTDLSPQMRAVFDQVVKRLCHV